MESSIVVLKNPSLISPSLVQYVLVKQHFPNKPTPQIHFILFKIAIVQSSISQKGSSSMAFILNYDSP